MALGNKQNNSNNKLLILKLKTADAEKKPVPVHFEITEKVDDKWTVTGEDKDVSGTLTKIELYEREWEGVVTPLVKIFLEDSEAQECYLLDLRYNMLSRNLFNNLLSLQSFENLKISLYDRKKEDKTYPAVSVRQNDALVNWKFEIKDLPPVEKVKVGKKEVTNFDNLNDFFIAELTKLAEKVKGSEAPKAEKAEKTEKVEKVAKPAAPAKKAAKKKVEDDALADAEVEKTDAPEDEIPF